MATRRYTVEGAEITPRARTLTLGFETFEELLCGIHFYLEAVLIAQVAVSTSYIDA